MKQQQRKLDFRKESILELTDSKLQSVEGGTSSIVAIKLSIQHITLYIPPPY